MSNAFPERISPCFARLIAQGNIGVARQVQFDSREESVAESELLDPIGDERFSPLRGVTHRYPNRLLLKPTLGCAVHCRFCFRRERLAKGEADLTQAELAAAIRYIEQNSQVHEVILTGGDPLTLSDSLLEELLAGIAAISHVRILRIHTRIPTAMPERINQQFLDLFARVPQTVWMVAHVNSAEELSPESRVAFRSLQRSGVSLLSQSVLLRGVNDSFGALETLFNELLTLGVKPYYLHYPDLARGTSHFRIPLSESIELIGELQRHLSGTAVPLLVVDLPSGGGKVPLIPANYQKVTEHTWRFRNPASSDWERVSYSNERI